MASNYWIKLYHEILDDPKMGRLPDRLWRRIIECFLMAGEFDQDGALPAVGDMAWRLRMDEGELVSDLKDIAKVGGGKCGEVGIIHNDGTRWIVTRFAERQAPVSDAERMRRYRDRQRKEQYYGDAAVTPEDTISVTSSVTPIVTNRNADTDTDTDKITDSRPHPFPEIRAAWGELLPDKPLPRENNEALRKKAITRMGNTYFAKNWRTALQRAARSTFCRDGAWFTLGWFLANGENWEKCLDGNYDDKPKARGNGTAPSAQAIPVPAGEYVHPDDFFAGGSK